MNNVLFYSFKIENIDFQSIDNLSISTPFDKADAVSNCRKELGKLGYKMAADNSHKIIKKDNDLFIEGMAYSGQDPTSNVVEGYLKSL